MKDSNFLKENNAKHLWHPMAHPADMRANAPQILTKGSGVRITDLDGHEIIDAVGGLWNVNLGYSCDAIKDAMYAQLNALPYYSIFRGTTNDVSIELSWMLREFFEPDGLTRAFYTSGGSDGVEIALRLARQYHKLRGEEGRIKYFSLKKGYHGTHTGGASVNGNSPFRTQYEPLLAGCHQMPCPWTYRNPFNESDPEKLAQLCLQAIEDEIAFQNPATIAAFIMEPILGAGGVIVPHASFMPGVREICHRNGILLIADEVITGYGRTGSWSGSRHWGVKPDFAVTAKAITNGYFPFGAVMVSEHVADAFERDETGPRLHCFRVHLFRPSRRCSGRDRNAQGDSQAERQGQRRGTRHAALRGAQGAQGQAQHNRRLARGRRSHDRAGTGRGSRKQGADRSENGQTGS